MSGASATPRRRPVVVVAEDDAAIRRMIIQLLSEDCDVVEAADGMQALQSIREMKRLPDLIVTDVMMPRLDGLGLLQQLRNDERGKAVPVIILTAKSRPMDVITGINAGARHYLTKPFKRDQLMEKVKRILRL
ncbi:MAG: response regulator [Myxococcota bacterium]